MGGRSVGSHTEPQSGQEAKPAAFPGCCGSLHAGAMRPCLGHAQREEAKEQRTRLRIPSQGEEQEVALQDQDRLAKTWKLSGGPRVDIALPPWASLGRAPRHETTFRELQLPPKKGGFVQVSPRHALCQRSEQVWARASPPRLRRWEKVSCKKAVLDVSGAPHEQT